MARLAGAPHQHGRADLDRHRAGARDVGGRDDPARRARLFRRRVDAAGLPVGRPLPRPEHAPQNARGGGKSRRAEGGNRDQVRRCRRNQRRADCRGRGRRHRAAASGRALRRRRRRDRRAVQDRPEPDHRRNLARESGAGDIGLCRHAQPVGRLAGAGVGSGRRHAAGGDRPAARQCRAGTLPLRAARRPRLAALCARWCMRRRC